MMRDSFRYALPFWLSMALLVHTLPVPLPTGTAVAQEAGPASDAPPPVLRMVWRGTQSPAFQGSKTAELLAATSLRESLASGWSALAKTAMAEGNTDVAETMDGPAGELFDLGWRRPMALTVDQLSGGGPRGGAPTFGLAWDLGDAAEAERLAGELRGLPRASASDAPAISADQGRLTVGTFASDPFADGEDARSTTTRDAQVVIELDVERMLDGIAGQLPPDEALRVVRWATALGLANVGTVAYVGRFDAEGWWQYRYLIEAPAPRTGLMRLFDAEPIGPESMAEVPASATWAGVYRLDPARLLGILRDAAHEIDESVAMQLGGVIGMASGMTGVDLEHDLLASLGDTWIAYQDPHAIGPAGPGLCLINKPRDAERLASAVSRLQSVVQAIANHQLDANQPGAPFRVNFQTQEVDGLTLHTINAMFVSPTWAVVGDRFILGLQPQVVVAAADAVQREGALAETDAFAAATRTYADRELTGIRFADLPETGPAAYGQLVGTTQLLASLGSLAGEDAPVMVLPPLHVFTPHLAPTAEAAWVDDAGVHLEGRVPFIGASLFSPQAAVLGMGGSGGMVVAPMLIGILLPALGAARRTARQMQSNTQLRGIHQSTIMWAQSHDGRLSHDVAELMLDHYFTAEYLLSPASGKTVPPGFGAWPDEQKARWAREHTDFFLVPHKTETLDSEEIGGFADPFLFDPAGQRTFVVYGDNHTVFETDFDRIRQLLREQTGLEVEQIMEMQRTGEWPDVLPLPPAGPSPRRAVPSPPPAPTR
jgi:hypothetical protein